MIPATGTRVQHRRTRRYGTVLPSWTAKYGHVAVLWDGGRFKGQYRPENLHVLTALELLGDCAR